MEDYSDPPTPDLDELEQRDDDTVAVPVRIDDPVGTYALPSRRAAYQTAALAADMGPVQVLGYNRARARALVLDYQNIDTDGDAEYFAARSREDLSGAQSVYDGGGLISGPFIERLSGELLNCDELWVVIILAAGSGTYAKGSVALVSEHWAD